MGLLSETVNHKSRNDGIFFMGPEPRYVFQDQQQFSPAVEVLIDIYFTRQELLSAFPPTDPGSFEKLLNFARIGGLSDDPHGAKYDIIFKSLPAAL